jgi:predicted neutral ceramidase superfamily lipid hydrolase
MIPPAIVLGLAITHLLSGFGRTVHRLAGHGRAISLDWIHLTWVVHIFLWMVFFWWYSYNWIGNQEWSFLVFMFLIVYTILLYLMCVILIPEDLDEVEDFGAYFMSLRAWFFAGVILLILVDFLDSAAKGRDNVVDLGAGYVSLRTFLLAGSVAAIVTTNRVYHACFAVVATTWTFLYFWLNRPSIGLG